MTTKSLQPLKHLILFFLLLSVTNCSNNKQIENQQLTTKIDAIINSESNKQFNGIVLISKDGEKPYYNVKGFSDLEQQKPLNINDQFAIGSISKQITAVLVLQAYEKGTLKLHSPISQYLKKLRSTWADTITVHHLLTHTHGITELNKPLSFSPGTQFQYSQLGFQLLADILSQTKNQSFSSISTDFFKKYGLNNTHHPKNKEDAQLVKGYTEDSKGNISFETSSFKNYVAAGGFISSTNDLLKWNTLLHNNKLLNDSTFNLLTTRYATRKHPIFDEIEYAYGLTFKKGESTIQIGALGFAPGFVSSNFYFPVSKTNVIILENVARALPDFKKTFYHHLKILEIVKQEESTSLNNQNRPIDNTTNP